MALRNAVAGGEGGCLPLLLRPESEIDLVEAVAAESAWVHSKLAEHGAVLFRGFGITGADRFQALAGAITPDLLNYVEGSSPRTMVTDKVYTSTEYPAEFPISMHNELSYAHEWPAILYFHCVRAATEGGATPLTDGREVLNRLPADLVMRFERHGVRYMRNLPGSRGAGLTWSTVFETGDRAWIESYCKAAGITFEWLANGGLRTSQVRPAVVTHPQTGERVWFNQADQWHPTNLGEELATALMSVVPVEDLPLNCTYGDGTPIDPDDLRCVREVQQAASVDVPWQDGDVLVIDNTLVAHGRRPYQGARRVLVTMGGLVRGWTAARA